MSNYATEQMLLSIKKAKDKAERAENEYDREVDQLQLKTEQSIDLFGGKAVSQVTDIVVASRKICDELYATYQMLIKILDEECRPLLAQEPEYRVVREVRNLIRKFNEESEIENNFTASLNEHNVGDVATRRYLPSIECKMIQSYWETKCDSWPGREETEEIERRVEERIKQYDDNIKSNNQERIAQYKKERDQWKVDCERISAAREAEIQKQLEKIQGEMEQNAEKKFEDKCYDCRLNIKKYTQIKTDAEAVLASLGLFKFEEKKAQKAIIADALLAIEELNTQIESAKTLYRSEIDAAARKAQQQRSDIVQQIEKTLVFPVKPEVPHIEGVKNANEFYQQSILEGMERGRLYDIADLVENIPELTGLATVRVSALVRPLADGGQIERVEKNRKPFFRLR